MQSNSQNKSSAPDNMCAAFLTFVTCLIYSTVFGF